MSLPNLVYFSKILNNSNTSRRYKTLAATLGIALVALSGAYSQDWAKVVAERSPAVCKIELMSGDTTVSSGSGFSIDKAGKVMTNAHVVAMARNDPTLKFKLTFSGSDKEYKDVSIAEFSELADCAILDVHTTLPLALMISKDKTPGLMTELLALGYPLGKSFKSTPGFLQAMQDIPGIGEMIDLSAAVDPGSSGGPVITKDGSVIGMVTAKYPGYNFNLALPSRVLQGFLSNVVNKVELTVTSEPSESMVFANGNFLGKTPLTIRMYGIDLALTVEREGYETGKETIKADKTESWSINVPLAQAKSDKVSVTIDTNPSGGKIWIDNTDVGAGPVVYATEKGARLRIRTKLRGYKEESRTEVLGDESDQKITIDLKKSFGF